MRRSSRTLRGLGAALALIIALILATPAGAFTLSRQDALIIVRSLLMLVPRPPPGGMIAVLPSGTGTEDLRNAEAVAALLSASSAKARVVPLDRLHEAADAVAVLVPPGLPDRTIGPTLDRTLLIGFDPDCITRDTCLLYIRSSGQVSITLNRQRLDRSGLRFDPAYRLLMHEQ